MPIANSMSAGTAMTRQVVRAFAVGIGIAAAAMFVPTAFWDNMTGAMGLSELLPAAAAPLGDTARALIAFAAGLMGVAAMLVVPAGAPRPRARRLAAPLAGHDSIDDEAAGDEAAEPAGTSLFAGLLRMARFGRAKDDAGVEALRAYVAPLSASKELGSPLPPVMEEDEGVAARASDGDVVAEPEAQTPVEIAQAALPAEETAQLWDGADRTETVFVAADLDSPEFQGEFQAEFQEADDALPIWLRPADANVATADDAAVQGAVEAHAADYSVDGLMARLAQGLGRRKARGLGPDAAMAEAVRAALDSDGDREGRGEADSFAAAAPLPAPPPLRAVPRAEAESGQGGGTMDEDLRAALKTLYRMNARAI